MRLAPLSIMLVVCLATISCQEYSTGLQTGSSRTGEASAIATLRTIAQAQTAYSISNSGHYATFEQLTEGGFLDARFRSSNPEFYGYAFKMQINPSGQGFSCNADPAPTAKLEGRHFYIDSDTQNVHVNASQPATATDEVVRP